MEHEWHELNRAARGDEIIVERVRLKKRQIAIEGSFTLPPLSRLSLEDQTFVIAFVRSHGSIKEMEALFGISYPTVKNWLNRISEKLEFVEINPPPDRAEVLDRLDKGEISVEEAEKILRRGDDTAVD
jgi:hypothetical protein